MEKAMTDKPDWVEECICQHHERFNNHVCPCTQRFAAALREAFRKGHIDGYGKRTEDLNQAYERGREEQRKKDAELLLKNVRHDHTSGECPYCEMPKVYAKAILSQRDDTKEPK